MIVVSPGGNKSRNSPVTALDWSCQVTRIAHGVAMLVSMAIEPESVRKWAIYPRIRRNCCGKYVRKCHGKIFDNVPWVWFKRYCWHRQSWGWKTYQVTMACTSSIKPTEGYNKYRSFQPRLRHSRCTQFESFAFKVSWPVANILWTATTGRDGRCIRWRPRDFGCSKWWSLVCEVPSTRVDQPTGRASPSAFVAVINVVICSEELPHE